MRTDPSEFDRLRKLSVLLAVLGSALLVVGGVVLTMSDASSYPKEMRAYYCEPGHEAELIPWSLWLVWGVMLAVAVASVVVAASLGPNDKRSRNFAILGVVAVALTCPLVAQMFTAMDCGL
jgi:zinc transporter ZupT